MAELQKDRIGGAEWPARPREEGRGERIDHIAVGYTDRGSLDDFIAGEQGDLTIHGPIHIGEGVRDAAMLGGAATEGMPCLVVPLIRERIDEIQREVSEVLNRFQAHAGPQLPPRRAAAGRVEEPTRPHSFRETGGDVRGASSGAIRTGSLGEGTD